MEDDSAIEMFVGGLVLDPNTQAPVVVLKSESGEIHLPIWIGVAEATSIASAIKELQMARPLTHDLIMDIMLEVGYRVERVMITELRDSTYFAELILAQGDKVAIFDSRPSDAIAIALRSSAPIFVAEEVLKQAQITFQQEEGAQSSGVEGEDSQGAGSSAGSGDEFAGSGVAEDAEDSSGESLSEGEESVEESISKNFKNIDKEKWTEMLSDLDSDDFKYKT